jgi:serine/threonine protein phosphatase PrpC
MNREQEKFSWNSTGQSHVGMVRQINEDAFLVDENLGLWAVADGMGGHEAGDIASKLVIDSLRTVSMPSNLHELLKDLRQRLMAANEEIFKHSKTLTVNGVMGSTVVTFLCYEGQGICLWAGDSRVYLCRLGQLQLLTRDHSQVEEMIRLGIWERNESENNPSSNIITRAVGVATDLKIDVTTGDVRDGDIFLLCSDGLNNVVSHNEIEKILVNEPCDESAQALIELALAKGAPDNVTVIVIHIK